MYSKLFTCLRSVQDTLGDQDLTSLLKLYKTTYENLDDTEAQKLLAYLNKKSFAAITTISKKYLDLSIVKYINVNGGRIMVSGPWKTLLSIDIPKTKRTLTDNLRLAAISKEGYDYVQEKYGGSLCGFTLLPPYRLHVHQENLLLWAVSRESDEVINNKDSHGVRGGIAALTMGLGKTLFGLTLAVAPSRKNFKYTHNEKSKRVYPTLIVSSKSIMYEWKVNAEKFFGCSIKILYMHNDFTSASYLSSLDRDEICSYDIVITTYDVIVSACKNKSKSAKGKSSGFLRYSEVRMKSKVVEIRERDRWTADRPDEKGLAVLYGTPWRRIILDESQKLANFKTQTYRAVMALHGDFKWCLSGTPIRNRPTDIWSQLRFIGYTGHNVPKGWNLDVFREHEMETAIFKLDYTSPSIKNLVVLPPKKIKHIPITHDGKEHELHQIILGAARDTLSQLVAGLTTYKSVLAIFMRLRQVSIAGHLIMTECKRNATEKEIKKESRMISKLKEGDLGLWLSDKKGTAGISSTKIQSVITTLKSIPEGEKVLIFSAFTSCLDLVSLAIKQEMPDVNFSMLDGTVNGKTRNDIRDRFRTDPYFTVLLLQYTVGSEGLNLQEANHVIFIEPTWSFTIQAQAEARCYRPGQTKPVTIYVPIVENSIEQQIVKLCEEKIKMTKNFLEGEDNEQEDASLNLQCMKKLLGVEDEDE